MLANRGRIAPPEPTMPPHDPTDPELDPEFAPRPASPWRARIVAALGLALVVAVGAYRMLRPAPYAALECTAPEREDAFRSGGRPRHDAQVRDALERSLPGLTGAATAHALHGRALEPELTRLRSELASESLTRALGRDAAFALRRLVGTFVDHTHGDADLPAVRTAARRFDAALEAENLGYRVEVIDLGTTVAGLLTYEVEQIDFVQADGLRVRVLRAERLDPLDVEPHAFGHVDPDDSTVVLPLERADRLTTTVLLPLVETPPFPSLADPRSTPDRFPFLPAAHASASSQVARAYAPPRCGAGVQRATQLLAERRALLLAWSELLLARGGPTLVMPDAYRLDLEDWQPFARVPRFAEFERLHTELGEPEAATGFACARDRLLESMLPGLVQRLVDERRDAPVPLPSVLLSFGGETSLVQGRTSGSLASKTATVRATLAAMATESAAPGLPLVLTLRCMTHGGRCNRDGEDAARIVMAELGREFALPAAGEARFLGPAQITELFGGLAQRSDAELARAGAAAFTRLFGDPPVRLGIRSRAIARPSH